jgi:hypothetical protein
MYHGYVYPLVMIALGPGMMGLFDLVTYVTIADLEY